MNVDPLAAFQFGSERRVETEILGGVKRECNGNTFPASCLEKPEKSVLAEKPRVVLDQEDVGRVRLEIPLEADDVLETDLPVATEMRRIRSAARTRFGVDTPVSSGRLLSDQRRCVVGDPAARLPGRHDRDPSRAGRIMLGTLQGTIRPCQAANHVSGRGTDLPPVEA